MKITNIEKITKKTEFNSYIDYETYPISELTCSNCNEKVSISFKDLKKHQLSDFTNLTEKDSLEFDSYIKKNVSDIPNSFIDYYCPNCKRPIKLLFESWAGGKHGEYGYKLIMLIEN